ncbi:hypothetical protein JCM10207_004527 [Rhodosporidiobolus poonsookiae]
MPKAPTQGNLSALFAINKPTGIPSMTLLNQLQPLFSSSQLFKDPNKDTQDLAGRGGKGGRGGKRRRGGADKVKMGQGGTLDPLADGVLVVGTNVATKHLSRFLDCTKEYRAIGLLGSSTDSYDSEGKRVKTLPWEGVTREKVEEVLGRFRGEIEQTPPIYSALKMDGKPLYEYARTNTPLPRPIPPRKVTVHNLSLLSFTAGDAHTYDPPAEALDYKARREIEALEKMVKEGGTVVPSVEEVTEGEKKEAEEAKEAQDLPAGTSEAPTPAPRPPIFEIRLTVSSGTYIRSIVHDIGLALGSAAHVVKLTRTRQGEFALEPEPAAAVEGAAQEGEKEEGEGKGEEPLPPANTLPCLSWELLSSAIAAHDAARRKPQGKGDAAAPPPAGEGEKEGGLERDADGWAEWERELVRVCKEV